MSTILEGTPDKRMALVTGRAYPELAKEGKNPFILDSKEPTLDFNEFLMGEVRYASLVRTFPETAEVLLKEAAENAKDKYASYKKLAEA